MKPLDKQNEEEFGNAIEETIGFTESDKKMHHSLLACAELLRNKSPINGIEICLNDVSAPPPNAEVILSDLKDFIKTSHIGRLDNKLDP